MIQSRTDDKVVRFKKAVEYYSAASKPLQFSPYLGKLKSLFYLFNPTYTVNAKLICSHLVSPKLSFLSLKVYSIPMSLNSECLNFL